MEQAEGKRQDSNLYKGVEVAMGQLGKEESRGRRIVRRIKHARESRVRELKEYLGRSTACMRLERAPEESS